MDTDETEMKPVRRNSRTLHHRHVDTLCVQEYPHQVRFATVKLFVTQEDSSLSYLVSCSRFLALFTVHLACVVHRVAGSAVRDQSTAVPATIVGGSFPKTESIASPPSG